MSDHIHSFERVGEEFIDENNHEWQTLRCMICDQKRRERISDLGSGIVDVEILEEGFRIK